MRKQLAAGLTLGLALAAFVVLKGRERTEAADDSGQVLAHTVFFSLKDNSAESKKKLVDACKKLLTEHPGEVYFAAGTLAEDMKGEFNDRDFDVALHMVFKDRAAFETYVKAKRHTQFVDENKDGWKKVRVFDSDVSK
jgi:Stress responsive A/B Barrel Domain